MSSDPADTNLFSCCLAVEGINAPLTRDDVLHPWVVELGNLLNIRYKLLDYVRLSSCTIADTYTLFLPLFSYVFFCILMTTDFANTVDMVHSLPFCLAVLGWELMHL